MSTSHEDRTEYRYVEAELARARKKFERIRLRRAEDGDIGSMCSLARDLQKRGDLDGAETWYQHAAMTGDVAAMYNLALLLEQRGKRQEAEAWSRRAAMRGDAAAMYNLALLLEQRGEGGHAEAWFRRAAEKDHVEAMVGLALELEKWGRIAEAETWWRTAADHGDVAAMVYMALLSQDRGEETEAETWWRRAVMSKDGPVSVVLAQQIPGVGGEWAPSESWWNWLTWGGSGAAKRYAAQLGSQQDLDGSETWQQRDPDTGRVWNGFDIPNARSEYQRLVDAHDRTDESVRRSEKFGGFYSAMWPLLYRYSRRIALTDREAGELVQDAMFRMLLRWDEFHALSAEDLRRIAYSSVRWARLDRRRAEYRDATYVASTPVEELSYVHDTSADEGAGDLIAEETTRQILRILTPRERELMTRVIQGKTTGEIAEDLGMNPDSVRRLISRARIKIRSELGLNRKGDHSQTW